MSPIMTTRIALKALARNKMRTALTMLGMIIGVSAVITLVALGSGAQEQVEAQIRAGGTNMVTVMAGNFTAGGVRGGAGAAASLKIEDLEAIRKEVPDIQYIAPGVNLRAQVIAGNQNWSTRLEGTDVDFPLIRDWKVKYGLFFSPQDVSGASRVAVLGKTVSDQLFGLDVDPTGQMIRIRNQPFKVIGVMDTKGQAAMGNDQDDTIFAPYTTVQKRLQGQQNIQSITISAASADSVAEVADAVAVVLRNQHKLIAGEPDDFMIRTQEEIASIRTASIETFTQLLAGIAAVSLIVGGIGIMNIMLVSVTERTREIGIRLAIGAKGRDVLLQFLVEAVVISLLGGGVGIALGFGMAELATRVWQFPTVVPPDAVAMAFGFSAMTGIFFGFYPAKKAAALDPIVALRYE
ncbi:MAG: FtsX-like permease family protein [Acidobacteria bacterium]|nr:FtsX-like permease family protein [Acidobacteriota bacterium]